MRQFIYADDLAEIILVIVLTTDISENIIVSSPEEVSIKDLAHMIADIMSFDGQIIFDDQFSDGQMRKNVSIGKFLNEFDNYKFVPLRAGLLHTIRWVDIMYPEIRKWKKYHS